MWVSLRDIQERSIGAILRRHTDVVVVAATATGKAEAAFLPIVSALAYEADDRRGRSGQDAAPLGVRAICVSPLKAMINDQYRRLASLCVGAGVGAPTGGTATRRVRPSGDC